MKHRKKIVQNHLLYSKYQKQILDISTINLFLKKFDWTSSFIMIWFYNET